MQLEPNLLYIYIYIYIYTCNIWTFSLYILLLKAFIISSTKLVLALSKIIKENSLSQELLKLLGYQEIIFDSYYAALFICYYAILFIVLFPFYYLCSFCSFIRHTNQGHNFCPVHWCTRCNPNPRINCVRQALHITYFKPKK